MTAHLPPTISPSGRLTPASALQLVGLYTTAGLGSGALEFLVANLHGPASDSNSQILQLLVACTCFGWCGLLVGILVAALCWLTRVSVRKIALGFLAVSITGYVAFFYSTMFAIVIALLAALVIVLSIRRNLPALISCLFVWLGFLHVLRPLYSGKSMELVFSGSQTFLIFCLVAPTLYLALCALLLRAFTGNQIRSRIIAGAQALVAISVAVWFAHLSGIFLIRLWGFHTMEFMQSLFITIQILLFGFCLGGLARFLGKSQSPVRMLPSLFICMSLLPMAWASNLVMKKPTVSSFVLKRLPNISLVLTYTALQFDRDRDGYSAAFGFGDCNDQERRIHPGAIDLPLDGVDANCFNGDLKSIVYPYFNQRIDISAPTKKTNTRPKAAIFVIVDTLRADAVDYSLTNNQTTPTLAEIASRSIQFTNAYAQSNNTLESFPFLFHIGFRNLSRYNKPWTLVSYLRDAGIPSAGVFQASIKEWWAEGMHEVLLGFDKIIRPELSIRTWSNDDNTDKAIQELKGSSSTDSFLFVHFESLHDYATKAMEGGRMITQGVNLSELSRLFDSQDLAATMRKRYMTTLSEADPAISRLWQVVQELEKTTDVLLIVASDHGEEFLEHGGFFHMGTLYQELVRVPLLVYTTGQTHKVIDTPVGLYRIAPSILKFLGFQGNFVADLDLRREPLNEFEIFGNYSVSEQVEQQNYMVVKNNTKLIYDLAHGQIELYDLKSDPGEQRNIFGDPKYRDIQQQLMVEMEAMLFYMSYGDLELLRVKDAAAAKGPGK